MEKERQIALIRALQTGDSSAADEFFSEIYNDVYYFALKTVKNADLAADVTQEAMIEVFSKLNALQDPAAFPAWCRQITYHQCTRYFRKKKDVLLENDGEDSSLFDTVEEKTVDYIPDEALDRKDLKDTILSFIDTLSEEQRSAVIMYYFDELSVAQIAEIQGVSAGTVKSRLNYARKAIKKLVEEYEDKNGIKLHALPFFPLFRLLFSPEKAAVSAPASAVSSAATAITAKTGVALSAGTTATVTTTATATMATGVAGVGAKAAAVPLAAKVVASVLAATVAIGGTTAGIITLRNRDGDVTETGGKYISKSSSTQTTNNAPLGDKGELMYNSFSLFGGNVTLKAVDPIVIETQDPFFGETQSVNLWVYMHVYPDGDTLLNIDTGEHEYFKGPVAQLEIQMPFPFGDQLGPVYSCWQYANNNRFELHPLAGDNTEGIRLEKAASGDGYLLTGVFSGEEEQTVRLIIHSIEKATTSTSTATTTTITAATTTTTKRPPKTTATTTSTTRPPQAKPNF